MLVGLYTISPFYQAQTPIGTAPLAVAIATKFSLITFGVLYSIPGFAVLYSSYTDNPKWTNNGLYWAWVVILFTSVLIVAGNGLRPFTWLAPLALGLISAILWIRGRWLE